MIASNIRCSELKLAHILSPAICVEKHFSSQNLSLIDFYDNQEWRLDLVRLRGTSTLLQVVYGRSFLGAKPHFCSSFSL